MVHGTVKGLLGLISTLLLIVLAFLALAAYRLSHGPVSLSILTPAIEQALKAPDGSLEVSLQSTELVWNRETLGLEIHVVGARVITATRGVIAALPEMSVVLSGPALLKGRVALRAVRLLHPHLHLLRDAEGRMAFGLGADGSGIGADADAVVQETIAALLAPPGGDTAAGQLRRVQVADGDLEFTDQKLGMHWHAPRVDILLARNTEGISGHLHLQVALDGQEVALDADGLYRRVAGDIGGTLSWTGVRPASLAGIDPVLAPLAHLHVVTAGHTSFRYALASGLSGLGFDITGGPGTIDATAALGTAWPVSAIGVRGSLGEGLDSLTLDEIRLDLGGPTITVAARADNIRAGAQLEASARFDNLPVDLIRERWPPKIAPNPRAWIVANISGGTVHRVDVKLAAHVPAGGAIGDIIVDKADGQMQGAGMAVRYLGALPPVQKVSASATFDQDAMSITVKSGTSGGLAVEGGTIVISGFANPDQYADINVKIAGPIADALRLIDNKPLRYASALGLDPAGVKGQATTQLYLRFPVANRTVFADIKLHAQARATGVTAPGLAFGLGLEDGDLALDVDAGGMDVTGKARLSGIPAALEWREYFDKGPFRRRYVVQATLDDAARRQMGLGGAPFQPPYLGGPVPTHLVATLRDGGDGDIAIKTDLSQAAVQVPGLGWEKKAGEAGEAEVQVVLAHNRVTAVPGFTLTGAGGLDIQGKVGFEGGLPRRVSLAKVRWNRTDVAGTLTLLPDGGLGIDVSGAAFDARDLVKGSTATPPSAAGGAETEEKMPLTIRARLGRVWLSDAGSLRDVDATLARDTHVWRQAEVYAAAGSGKPVHFAIRPDGERRRLLRVTAADAGAAFAALDVLTNMRNGQLEIDGVFDDAKPHHPLSGTARITDYQVVKAPLLARVLTVAALTGVVDVLSGSGIHFSRLQAPFTLVDGVLTLDDARTSGTEIGITARGQIDLDRDELALEGTIVPAYAVNSALGNIPLVGQLFTGEKGGGVIAINYAVKGPSKNPAVTVNPLSALTPGILRRLFDLFSDKSDTQVRTGKGGSAETPPR